MTAEAVIAAVPVKQQSRTHYQEFEQIRPDRLQLVEFRPNTKGVEKRGTNAENSNMQLNERQLDIDG